MTMKITKTIFLKAPPAHVWTFLTDPDKLAVWFHRGGGEMVVGGEYALLTNSLGKEGDKLCWGTVMEMDPPNRLVHSFTHKGLKGVETTVTWELEDVEGGTILHLVHDGWEQLAEGAFNTAASHDTGWDEHFIRLRRVAG